MAVLLAVRDARAMLGIGNTKVYELIRTGALRSVKIGARRLVPEAAIDEYIADLERLAETA